MESMAMLRWLALVPDDCCFSEVVSSALLLGCPPSSRAQWREMKWFFCVKCGVTTVTISVGYTSDDVSYRWTTGRGVNIARWHQSSLSSDTDTDPDTAATWSSHSSTSSPLPPATRLRSGARVKLYYWHSSVIRQKIIPGSFSTLVVSFHLQRHMGDFVIQVSKTCQYIVKVLRNSVVDTSSIKIWWQVYGPCILLVVISWVSFWLNREATSDRISLGT